MNGEQASWLAELQFHWDTAYEISYNEADNMWYAWRKGDRCAAPLTGMVPEQLREKIREDYLKRNRTSGASSGHSERLST